MKYHSYLDESKLVKESIIKKFNEFKKKKPKYLDATFQAQHESAFTKIDCMECANCCKTTSPIFRDVDIKRIARKLRMSEFNFESDFLTRDSDNDWVLKTTPCHFLDEDNKCGIYEFRPQACRDYPHTDRKKVIQILDLTLKNTEICPAVALIATNLSKEAL